MLDGTTTVDAVLQHVTRASQASIKGSYEHKTDGKSRVQVVNIVFCFGFVLLG